MGEIGVDVAECWTSEQSWRTLSDLTGTATKWTVIEHFIITSWDTASICKVLTQMLCPTTTKPFLSKRKLFLPIILTWPLPTTTSVRCMTTSGVLSSTVLLRESSCYHRRENTLPANHPHLATSYNNIGFCVFNHGRGLSSTVLPQQSPCYPTRKLFLPIILTWPLPTTTSVRCMSKHGRVLSSTVLLKQSPCYPRENSSCQSSFDLATSYNNIGAVYKSMGDYSQALSCHNKALAIDRERLFLPVILTWLLHTTTSVRCIRAWESTLKHCPT